MRAGKNKMPGGALKGDGLALNTKDASFFTLKGINLKA